MKKILLLTILCFANLQACFAKPVKANFVTSKKLARRAFGKKKRKRAISQRGKAKKGTMTFVVLAVMATIITIFMIKQQNTLSGHTQNILNDTDNTTQDQTNISHQNYQNTFLDAFENVKKELPDRHYNRIDQIKLGLLATWENKNLPSITNRLPGGVINKIYEFYASNYEPKKLQFLIHNVPPEEKDNIQIQAADGQNIEINITAAQEANAWHISSKNPIYHPGTFRCTVSSQPDRTLRPIHLFLIPTQAYAKELKENPEYGPLKKYNIDLQYNYREIFCTLHPLKVRKGWSMNDFFYFVYLETAYKHFMSRESNHFKVTTVDHEPHCLINNQTGEETLLHKSFRDYEDFMSQYLISGTGIDIDTDGKRLKIFEYLDCSDNAARETVYLDRNR